MNQPIILASATVFAAVGGDELEGLVKELVQSPEVIQRMKTFLQN